MEPRQRMLKLMLKLRHEMHALPSNLIAMKFVGHKMGGSKAKEGVARRCVTLH